MTYEEWHEFLEMLCIVLGVIVGAEVVMLGIMIVVNNSPQF